MPVERRRCQGKCKKMRQLKFFVGEKGRICITCQKQSRRLSSRLYRILQNYGLSADDYWLLYAACGGRCMICHGKRKTLDVDHDHRRALTHGMRASVRGLICARENRWAIPGVAGDYSTAYALAQYLRDPPGFSILGTADAPPLANVPLTGTRPGASRGRRHQGLHQGGRRR